MKKGIICLVGILSVLTGYSQLTYRINIDQPEKIILRDHLNLGGKNPAGEEISVNSYYIEKDGKPFIPIIGEFHYSRFPAEYWEEEILKMKAGGINVIASYVFWILHERQEGQYDWSGDLNLRKFLELIKKHDLYAIVRLGPFCHGEMRNGGIPDWLYGRPFEIRSNDPEYLTYVDSLYGEIAKQMEGLLYKEGGPVIGVQLENEYQHSASPWEFSYPGGRKQKTVADREAALTHEQITVTDGKNPWAEYGKLHMSKLKELAKKNGMDVPLYTATGWGNATIVEKGSLPVTAGYAYPFWADPRPSPFYLFKDIQKYPDYSPVSYDTDIYPSMSAEIGPGIQVKYSRRPVVPYESVRPLMVRIMGSGSNGIGYYMYHGGSTPQYDGKFYNEEANGLPRVNYDFQAPVGQYGQVRFHYKDLRMLHMFIDAFGEFLAPMKTVLPQSNENITPDNTDVLRYAVRSYGESGFLFIINFQDHVENKDIVDIKLEVETKDETLSFPMEGTFNVLKSTSAILPFNLNLGNTILKTATVQPLTVLHGNANDYYIFSTIKGMDPELNFSSDTKISELTNALVSHSGNIQTVKAENNLPFTFTVNGINIVVIPHDMAFHSVKFKDKLLISEALVLDNKDSFQLISRKAENTLYVFPSKKQSLTASNADIREEDSTLSIFDTYSILFEKVEPKITFEKISTKKYTLQLESDVSTLNNVFVEADYIGDRGLAFIDGVLITDHFYQERKWEIGLKKFIPQLKDNKMLLMFQPMYSDYGYLKDLNDIPDFEKGSYLEVKGFDVVPEYKTKLVFE